MALYFGIPEAAENASLGNRLARLTLLRLVFLAVLLGIIGRWYMRGVGLRSFSVQVAFIALGCSFALAAVYAAILRTGKHLKPLAYTQILFDQLTWTLLVYLSGGANSGATSLYGLSALTGAMLLGLPAAGVSASLGFAIYLALCGAMFFGIIPPPPDQGDVRYPTTFDELVYPLGLNLIVLIVVTMLGGYLAERLRLTGGQLQKATARAEQAERLALLGRVAAGLAHEIRNPLGSISASVELLRDATGLSEDDRRLCDIIQTESVRLNDLVGDMLDLTRPRQPVLEPTDVAEIAREVVVLASRTGRGARDVGVRFIGPTGQLSPRVSADCRQLRQVIWNLVRNGIQSADPGTDVTVRVDAAAQVVVDVTDHGAGIAADAKAHLFDAFFTTRSHGAGIGLAVVKRIVDDHGWAIEVLSEANSPTIFRVLMPRLEAESPLATELPSEDNRKD